MLTVAFLSAGCSQPAPPADGKAAGDGKVATGEAPKTEDKATPAGKPVEIVLKSVDPEGLQKAIDDLTAQKKAVFVDFWATWCVPCREAFPHTVELSKKYAGDGLAVISVALEEDPKADEAKVKAFLAEQKADFTHFVSTQGAEDSMEAFAIDGGGIPHYRVYDKEGKLVRKFVFGDPEQTFSADDVEAAIRKAVGAEGAAP